jgi:hypothetical protein
MSFAYAKATPVTLQPSAFQPKASVLVRRSPMCYPDGIMFNRKYSVNDLPGIATDDPKNVYFLLGQSLHTCQSFEHAIQLTVSVLSSLGVEGILSSKAAEILEGKSPKPLGQLLDVVGKMMTINEDGEIMIGKALAARNRIIHRIIRENAEGMLTVEGRIQIVNELKKLDFVIVWVRDFFIDILKKISEIYGISHDVKSI